MIHKIISYIVLSAIIFSQNLSLYAESEITNLWKYTSHAQVFDQKVGSIPKEKLISTAKKINIISPKQDGETKALMDHVLLSIKAELNSRAAPISKQEKIVELQDTLPTLSDSQKLTIQQQVLSAQSSIMSEMTKLMDSTIAHYNELTRYEETGDISTTIDLSIENFLKLQWELDISKYIIENQLFDQSFNGDIAAKYTASVAEQNVDIAFGTNLSFISKDGNSYIKFTDLNFSNSNKDIELDITPYIQKLEALSKENTYLSLASPETTAVIEILENFNQWSMTQEMQRVFGTALFEAYDIQADEYLLRPTKHFCDIWKELIWVFDPFGGKNCSDSQYQDMLDELLNSGFQMRMKLWTVNTLTINSPTTQNNQKINTEISWRAQDLLSFVSSIYNEKNPEDIYMNFEYIPKRYLSMNIPKNPDNMEMSLLMNIDRNGNISRGNISLTGDNNLSIQGKYENHKLDITLTAQDNDISVSCMASWDLRAQLIDMQANCSISSQDIIDLLDSRNKAINLKTELLYDTRNNKNNISLIFNGELDANNYISFDISGVGTRRSVAKSEIKAPEKTQDFTEFLTEIYSEALTDAFSDFGSVNIWEDDFEYEFNEYDDYTEDCFLYKNGNKTCTEYYSDKSITCEYTPDARVPECTTIDFGYTFEEIPTETGTKTCYTYDNWDRDCYEYLEEYSITCNYIAQTDNEECSRDEYDD